MCTASVIGKLRLCVAFVGYDYLLNGPLRMAGYLVYVSTREDRMTLVMTLLIQIMACSMIIAGPFS